jgi:hypothetical protein
MELRNLITHDHAAFVSRFVFLAAHQKKFTANRCRVGY